MRVVATRHGVRSPAERAVQVRPLLPLDRILAAPAGAMTALAVHATPLARLASDHLPLKASLVWP